VRLGTYSARYGILPPAAVVATRAQATDPRAAPRYGERIPYVVVYGEPGAGAMLAHALAAPPDSGRARSGQTGGSGAARAPGACGRMGRDAARTRAGARLIDVVIAPHALVEAQGRLRLNVTYYITKGVRAL